VKGKLAHSAAAGANHRNACSTRDARVLAHIRGLCIGVSLFACTEPAERTQLRVRIDAAPAARELVDDVDVVVETQGPAGGGWQTLKTRRFEPKVRDPWPLDLPVDAGNARLSYQVTATARDDRGAIVAQARAVREWDALNKRTILLVFEASCVRRAAVCVNGQTCHGGECVDAHYEAESTPTPTDDAGGSPAPAEDAGPDPGGPTLAVENETCSPDGARACTDELSRTPLHCEEGSWRSAPICAEDELCDTTPGAMRGMCRRVKDECRGHMPSIAFCDHDMMLVCKNMFASEVRPCDTNQRCLAAPEARCVCETGFIRGAVGCERPRDCTVENGGCDPMTLCSIDGTERTCSECPTGYVGEGATGCEPLLAGLMPSAGQLSPAFDPAARSYRVKVPLLSQQLTLTPSAPSASRIELNGTSVTSGSTWTTPTLPLGEFPVKLTLTSSSGETSDYTLVVERGGDQTAYLKASNVGEGDHFGISVAMSRDTLVVGALYEDSSAVTVDGDQSNNGKQDAGAAYVFVRRGDTWEQQAYLKPTDTAATDYFGTTVAIDADTIVVGAIHDNVLGLSSTPGRPGVAYVFTRAEGRWSQAAKLAPMSGAPGDLFGYGVAVQGDTIAVGAPGDAGDGAAYVFTRAGTEWREQQKIKTEAKMQRASFGSAVSVSKDTLLVGSSDDSTEMMDAGSAYVYTRNAGTWALETRLVPAPVTSGANFGYAVALRGDEAIIGAPRIASIISLAVTSPGEVFGFRRTGKTWLQTHVLRAMLPRSSDSFGSSVALSDTAALIGACGDTSGAQGVGADASRRDGAYSGAAYLYAHENQDWKLSAYLKAGNADANDMFGFGAALSDDSAVLSAVWERSNAAGVNGNAENNSLSTSGAVYVFE